MADKSTRIAIAFGLFLPASTSFGDIPHYSTNVGDEYQITKSYETSSQTNSGSSGSSSGRDTIVERVIGVREGGLEIEYDFPDGTTEEARARSWQFPVRVFRPSSGPMQLLNRPELEVRVEAWLQAGGMTREVCGRWIFTWNAFRIECDPESVIDTLNSFDLRVEYLEVGAPYEDVEAISVGTLEEKATGENSKIFAVTLQINPDVVWKARAESDVVVGELLNEPITFEEALGERAKEIVSGTIMITLEADLIGNVWRRTKETEVETKFADGNLESRRAVETVERHPIPRHSDTE